MVSRSCMDQSFGDFSSDALATLWSSMAGYLITRSLAFKFIVFLFFFYRLWYINDSSVSSLWRSNTTANLGFFRKKMKPRQKYWRGKPRNETSARPILSSSDMFDHRSPVLNSFRALRMVTFQNLCHKSLLTGSRLPGF